MKKKILLCAAIASLGVSAAVIGGCNLFNRDKDIVEQDNMRFELKDDGTYELVQYNLYLEDADGNVYEGDGEKVTVPSEVKGKAVTSLKNNAFNNSPIKSVVLPDGIKAIPDNTFMGCSLLTEITIPDTVTEIGERAFIDCSELAEIEIPSGVTSLGKSTFYKCESLTEITLPVTCKSVGSICFYETSLQSFTAQGLETVGERAFCDCTALEVLDAPKLKNVDYRAFSGCTSLTEVDTSELVYVGESAFYNTGITELYLPNIETLGEASFSGCRNLVKLTIGPDLKKCDASFGYSNIEEVSIDSPVPDNFIKNSEKLKKLTLGEGVTSVGKSAFSACTALTSVQLPSALESLGGYAFFNCDALERISFPASLKSIGDYAFSGCYALSAINFSEGLETIGNSAFAIRGSKTLEIVLPSTVKTVGSSCFYGITAAKLHINETVESVGRDAFRDAVVASLKLPVNYEFSLGYNGDKTALTELTLFGEGTVSGDFKNCTALTKVHLCEGVTDIGYRAFEYAALQTINLENVNSIGSGALGSLKNMQYTKTENGINYIGDWIISSDYSGGDGKAIIDLSEVKGVYQYAFRKTDANDTSVINTLITCASDGTSALKQIGADAFYGTSITAVEIPSTIEEWHGAFEGCKLLNNVVIGEGIKRIANSAFDGCTSLMSVNLSYVEGLTEIGEYAFSSCTSLVSITLPDSIKVIDRYAFFHCTSLTSISLPDGVEVIGEYAFGSCTKLTSFSLPASLKEIGAYALYYAEEIDFDGTEAEWDEIDKGGEYNRNIWGTNNDLVVNFSDGSSKTYKKEQ
ncbi:MAG: leucine-rich repeat domain-containing protein [Clostridia bacterium]|nr:leucine-rich repeat domain-containing protein [Clostridia bacterium]